MRKAYRLSSWKGWDKHVDACVRDFEREFGMAPNLLVAGASTLRRINVAADKARVGKENGEVPDPGTYVELSGFAGDDYELLFVEEEDVPDNEFALIKAFESESELVAML